MRLNKPNPDSTIRVTVRDEASNTSKSRTYYDTTIEEVLKAIEAIADDQPAATPDTAA